MPNVARRIGAGSGERGLDIARQDLCVAPQSLTTNPVKLNRPVDNQRSVPAQSAGAAVGAAQSAGAYVRCAA